VCATCSAGFAELVVHGLAGHLIQRHSPSVEEEFETTFLGLGLVILVYGAALLCTTSFTLLLLLHLFRYTNNDDQSEICMI
jgi:hypothetical protein